MSRVSPNQPKTPVRTLRADDETWAKVTHAARAETAKRGERVTASDVIRDLINQHLPAASTAQEDRQR